MTGKAPVMTAVSDVGEIPPGWRCMKLAYLATMQSGEGITSETINPEGLYPVYGGNGLRGFTDRSTHDGEFVLIGRQGALCGNVHKVSGQFWASEHAVVARVAPAYHVGWFAYLLEAMKLNQYSVSAAQPGLAVDRIRALTVPVPARDIQCRMAHFLDRKTAAIDSLIAQKERLVAALEQKLDALISRAVYRGIDLNQTLRASSVDGIPDIPLHWEMKRLKHLTNQVTVGIVITPAKYYVNEGVPCPRSLNVKPGKLLDTSMVFISREANLLHEKSIIRTGDLVCVRTGQPGTTAVVDARFDGANCIDLIIIRASERFDSRYLCFFMNSSIARRQYQEGSEGALQQHFNVAMARNLWIPCPPRHEQERLADYLERQRTQNATIRDQLDKQLASIREYRQALITAAVTGKIDVSREEAAS